MHKMAAKIINLDDLIPESQIIILDGTEHEVHPPTVDSYLKIMKSREKLRLANDEAEQMNQAINLIVMSCPTLTRERLGRLPLKALTALTDIIQELMGIDSTDEEAFAKPGAGDAAGE
jgi:hypothetical protein